MTCKLWFGTIERMRWVETPLSGADSTPQGWNASGSLLNGGGWVKHSWGSHKLYEYSWRDSSARQAAQLMKSYRDGVFGRGLIYFIDPLIYDTNILPAQWAAPGINIGNESAIKVPGVTPTLTSTPWGEALDLPATAAQWSFPTGAIIKSNEVFIPIPAGYQLHLGGMYEGLNAAPVFRRVMMNGVALDDYEMVPQLNPEGNEVVSSHPITGRGIYLSIQRTSREAGILQVQALCARLIPIDKSAIGIQSGPWVGGQGHSGCRFDGEPTYIEYNGVGGGQVGYAATFREVGSWE